MEGPERSSARDPRPSSGVPRARCGQSRADARSAGGALAPVPDVRVVEQGDELGISQGRQIAVRSGVGRLAR